MNLAIDIDGVLRDFVGALIQCYKEDFPDHSVKEVLEWDLHKFFPIGKEIYAYAFKTRAGKIFGAADAFEGAASFIQHLQGMGHKVWLVTDQPKGEEHHTLRWLQHNEILYDAICFTKSKEFIDCDIFLDDAEHNLRAIRGEKKRAICLSRPWNSNWDGERIHRLTDFLRIVSNGKHPS